MRASVYRCAITRNWKIGTLQLHVITPLNYSCFLTQVHEAADADSLQERICAICLEPAKTTMKACCGKGMHKACLAHWLRISGQRWPLSYGENAAYLVGEGSVDVLLDCEVKPGRLVPHFRPDGRAAVTDHPVNTKTCPCCRKTIQSLAHTGFDR